MQQRLTDPKSAKDSGHNLTTIADPDSYTNPKIVRERKVRDHDSQGGNAETLTRTLAE